MLLISAPQFAVAWFGNWRCPVRTVVAVGMFPVAGAVVAAVFGWIDGYWSIVR